MEVSFCAQNSKGKSEIPADHLSATTTYRRDHLIAEVYEAWTQRVLKRLGARVHSRVEMKYFLSFVGKRRVVSGASVRATVQGTGISRASRTDDSSHYLMPLLSIGDYNIRVESQGFAPA